MISCCIFTVQLSYDGLLHVNVGVKGGLAAKDGEDRVHGCIVGFCSSFWIRCAVSTHLSSLFLPRLPWHSVTHILLASMFWVIVRYSARKRWSRDSHKGRLTCANHTWQEREGVWPLQLGDVHGPYVLSPEFIAGKTKRGVDLEEGSSGSAQRDPPAGSCFSVSLSTLAIHLVTQLLQSSICTVIAGHFFNRRLRSSVSLTITFISDTPTLEMAHCAKSQLHWGWEDCQNHNWC